jgi:hypothetical protein
VIDENSSDIDVKEILGNDDRLVVAFDVAEVLEGSCVVEEMTLFDDDGRLLSVVCELYIIG